MSVCLCSHVNVGISFVPLLIVNVTECVWMRGVLRNTGFSGLRPGTLTRQPPGLMGPGGSARPDPRTSVWALGTAARTAPPPAGLGAIARSEKCRLPPAGYYPLAAGRKQMMVGSPPPKGRGGGLVSTPALHRRGGAPDPGGRSGGGVLGGPPPPRGRGGGGADGGWLPPPEGFLPRGEERGLRMLDRVVSSEEGVTAGAGVKPCGGTR